MPPKQSVKGTAKQTAPTTVKKNKVPAAVVPQENSSPSNVRRSARIPTRVEIERFQPAPAAPKRALLGNLRTEPVSRTVTQKKASGPSQRKKGPVVLPSAAIGSQRLEANPTQTIERGRLDRSDQRAETEAQPHDSSPTPDVLEGATVTRSPETPSTTDEVQPLTAADLIEFYRSRGYEVPDEEYMASPANSIAAPPSSIAPKGKPKAGNPEKPAAPKSVTADGPRFSEALEALEIDEYPSPDSEISHLKKLLVNNHPTNRMGSETVPTHGRDEEHWQADMNKCISSNEAIFQRTIMMSILNRHSLDDKLDFVCEEPWNAWRMHSEDPLLRLAPPKPDLAVAFRSEKLLDEMRDIRRLGYLKGRMCPEGCSKDQKDRAFHFFSLEVKGKRGMISNSVAENQNLNTASRALENIALLLEETGDLDTLFKDVRVFSAVATTVGFEVRVHRAIRLSRPGTAQDGRIGFAFAKLKEFTKPYARSDILNIMYNILIKYGVEKLYPILKRNLDDAIKAGVGAAPQSSLGKRPADSNLDPSLSFSSVQRQRVNGLSLNEPQE